MNHNKQSIRTTIAELEKAVLMEIHIRKTVEKFKHCKLVNNRFIEALKEGDIYNAYITKDKYSTSLTVYPNSNTRVRIDDRIEFRVYLSHCISEIRLLTWDLIEKELVRHSFEKRLENYRNMLPRFEEERETLGILSRYIDSFELSCFDLYEVKRILEDKLDYAHKE